MKSASLTPFAQLGHADFATVAFLWAIALFNSVATAFINTKWASAFKAAGVGGPIVPGRVDQSLYEATGWSELLRFILSSDNSKSCAAHVMPTFHRCRPEIIE